LGYWDFLLTESFQPQNWVPELFPGRKGGWCVGLANLTPSCANVKKLWESKTPGAQTTCPGLWWDSMKPRFL
jgi:hypothetical protein